jgi:hypothetical protein
MTKTVKHCGPQFLFLSLFLKVKPMEDEMIK